ncbi:MAG: 1-acyl-sn-glycerol-3-phosphate acyltransferase [Pseudomonadota bacterium]|mgnify:FL=1|nr:1-acyl-sn-glycerol-3-phosphate acyltransferase [Pseudomonadota bacterium]
MEKFKRGLRAFSRVPRGLGIIGRLAWDVYVKRVQGDDLKEASNRFYKSLADLLGIKILFNKESAPIVQDSTTWYVANHMSVADFIVTGSVLKNGTFAGKELKLPEPLLQAAKYIGIKRVPKEHADFQKYNRMTQGRIIKNFNEGQSTIMFPEGTITDGSRVALFRQGLLSLLFGNAAGLDQDGVTEIKLEQSVKVQPIGIKVKDVEGKCVDMRPEMRHYYSHFTSLNTIKRIWTRLATESITIELKAFEPLDPADFNDAKDLANAAGELVRSFAAPDQVGFEKAKIPGVRERGEKDDTPPPPQRGLY